jgi:hypothetical protein
MSTSSDKKLAKKTKVSKEQQFASKEAMAALLDNIGCKNYRMELGGDLSLKPLLPLGCTTNHLGVVNRS